MKQQILTMLKMQYQTNQKVHSQWVSQNFEWYRAIWIECGELMDHVGYKWWKQQLPDMNQVQLEVVDIWHFGMSALMTASGIDSIDQLDPLASEVADVIESHSVQETSLLTITEALAGFSLDHKNFSVEIFCDMVAASDMDFTTLYRQYIGKNVLNFFRQDHGYKDGSYVKVWDGREDNEHLVDIMDGLDTTSPDYREDVYQGLASRYRAITEPA